MIKTKTVKDKKYVFWYTHFILTMINHSAKQKGDFYGREYPC